MDHKNKTLMLRREDVPLMWYTIDAAGKTLGRLAVEIAKILRGKHKPTFTLHADVGDGVIVLNADQIVVTGNKAAQKLYRHYTGYIGGLREIPYARMMDRKPEYIIEHAVKGMVPKTKLGRHQMKRLRVFATGVEPQMEAQQPITVNC
jgi:large subunit ribosomal protein L13